jgi:ribonuclease HI
VRAPHVLRTDGGARGNPGPAGAGFVLEDAAGTTVVDGGKFLGVATNNEAEYEALRWGLETALAHDVREIEVRADSELVVRQVLGVYRVRNARLAPMHAQVMALLGRFESHRIMHVRRAENQVADDLANAAMDCRGTVGSAVAGDGTRQQRLFEEGPCTS